jgi:hypothetical protein
LQVASQTLEETSPGDSPSAVPGTDEDSRAAQLRGNLLFDHDFGLVRPNGRVTHKFEVTNRTDFPRTLRHVERTCVCTVAKCPRRIEPGSTAEVELEYRAAGASADDERAVELYFNETGAPVLRFTVRASIRPPVAASRKELIFRGTGQSYLADEVFEIENFSAADWSSVTVGTGVSWATAVTEFNRVEKSGVQPHQVWQVQVRVDARGMKPGRYNTALEIQCDAVADARLPMWLDLAAPVAVIPERLFFGNVSPEGKATCTVLLHCNTLQTKDLEPIRLPLRTAGR